MSLLTTIDNIPLYDTMREALIWGKQYGIQGYHIHYYNNIRGYMSGATHEEIREKTTTQAITPLSFKDFGLGDFAITDEEKNLYRSLNPKKRKNRKTLDAKAKPTRSRSTSKPQEQPQPRRVVQPRQTQTRSSRQASTGSSSVSYGGGY